jgi:hypothetical protein
MRTLTFVSLLLCTGLLQAGEKKLMHCFTFTPIETATPAEWKAFYEASDEMPKKIPGVSRVWYGKLRSDSTVYNSKGGPSVRKHGMCIEMKDESTLKTYADHPYHKQWVDVYSKVRVEGTSTFDILGQ